MIMTDHERRMYLDAAYSAKRLANDSRELRYVALEAHGKLLELLAEADKYKKEEQLTAPF